MIEINKNIFIPLYTFQCEESLLDKVEKTFDSQHWMKDQHNYNTDQYYQPELSEWFHNCIDKVKQIHYAGDFKLEITSCWVNKNNRMMKSPLHYHYNSIVSGVLYFSNEQTSPLVFSLPNPYAFAENQRVLNLSSKYSNLRYEIFPKRGMLVIFPSSIMHETATHRENHLRYSIAFNTFMSGLVSDNPTTRLKLSLT